MHNLPDTLFYPKNSSHPQSYRGEVLPSANLDPGPLILNNEGKFRGNYRHQVLEMDGFAVPVI